ncbi:TPA: hypothetical protein UN036_001222 [Stenotrophomonas maltophilia]|uniref:hypothetical protein n=1 Tax=Stenotrophomonas maltophilia TaxID=40324 RepID=UPI001C609DB8|nr:hypothetical protein [Stenotrophomonas maltophilia]HEL3242056.1 hypothetical protein [Stenotrophomonas maltophilia]HEL3250337.1 hypothetical protein [Stenotrophomonas maltophilia]HEL4278457.1 hypothetical protein [Stenotrophomonas maltophilia]HEL4661920.1 hypothetical protein [Stenotrophomonas maltophilia]HEL4848097.1 hypothetical protein [Stenotrophomonas maltophilia]
MFIMLESRTDIAAAQNSLKSTLEAQSDKTVKRTIGYPGGHTPDQWLSAFGNQWFWSGKTSKQDPSARRSLNWFGFYSDEAGVDITVEINTVPEGLNNRIGGFFARHSETGVVYLFHSARVGGGRKGVGKEAFLAWSAHEPQHVTTADGGSREGVLVGPVSGKGASRSILRYVQSVADFKRAVREGAIDEPAFQNKLLKFREVVEALKVWREEQGLLRGRRLVKSVLVDLGVEKGRSNKLEEVYEVKTSIDRSCVYGGIGQLMVHGNGDCRRVLVLPADGELLADLSAALDALGIELVRYRLGAASVKFGHS